MILGLPSDKKVVQWPNESLRFCELFLGENTHLKYIMGRNIYTEALCNLIKVDGIVDDFTTETNYKGLPIIKVQDIPPKSMVLNASGGRPLSAKYKLDSVGLSNLDYFAFYQITRLALPEVRFNEGFEHEYLDNKQKYAWIYDLLNDEKSKEQFLKLINFRFSHDIVHLNGFTQKEDIQYFEDFLDLKQKGETFIDVGAYDGFTSKEFIKRCPNYEQVFAFEPDSTNFKKCAESLAAFPNVSCMPIGLSNRKGILQFDVSGSASKISDSGTVKIAVDRLDDVLKCKPTFIKMDIEGGESAAIEGATQTILDNHPRLAISVYHSAGDFWRIPHQILSIRSDYDIKLRHYTESIYETVMFFLPKQ